MERISHLFFLFIFSIPFIKSAGKVRDVSYLYTIFKALSLVSVGLRFFLYTTSCPKLLGLVCE